MLTYILVVAFCFHLGASQDCSSSEFDFTSFVNPEQLDLTTPPGTVVARFAVEHVQSATVETSPTYISPSIVGSELRFITTEDFAQYEEHEILVIIIIQVTYRCTTGQRQGIYRQSLKLANNHAPRFLQEPYKATVPLPLPKHFDLSPFLANGDGIMARDVDLVNNTVTFSISENDYVLIESHTIATDRKQFRAILRLKEQVLKMPHNLELTVTATDRGVPPKSSQASVTIEPDLSIVYDDPPEFKDTFVNRTIEQDLLIQLELIPGIETGDVKYSLDGPDAQYFSPTVWTNNTGIDLRVVKLDNLPKSKTYINVVVLATRSELQKASCVILLNIPVESHPEVPDVSVEKVLAVQHLVEMAEHRNIFPLAIENCVYSIKSQTPGEYFFIEEAELSLSSKPFDRENAELFIGLDFPQFWLVLKLSCPPNQSTSSSPLDSSKAMGPMRDIDFSTDLTHLNIIVDDINDNSPVFTYPASNAWFAYPSSRISQKLLPEGLVQIKATDLDEGINAVIRYSLAPNDHFEIDPRTGVIFPLKTALAGEPSTTLDVFATDRDGAEDGNTSTMKINVVRALEDQLIVIAVNDMDPESFERTLAAISEEENIDIHTLRNVYSVAGNERKAFSVRSSPSGHTTTAVVYAFKGDKLLPYNDMDRIFKSLQTNFTFNLSKMADIYGAVPVITDSNTTIIYPYIIVAAFCGTIAVAMTAAMFYYRAKARQPEADESVVFPSRPSNGSDAEIMKNAENVSVTVTPLQTSIISEATVTESVDNPRSLTELLAIDEGPEHEESSAESKVPSQHDRKKSIKFNENVERIEVFDNHSEG